MKGLLALATCSLLACSAARAEFQFKLESVGARLGVDFVDEQVALDSGAAFAFGLEAEFGRWNDMPAYFHFDRWSGKLDSVTPNTEADVSEMIFSLGLKRKLELELPFQSHLLLGGGLSFYKIDENIAPLNDTATDISLHIGYEADFEINDQVLAFAQVKKATNGGNTIALQAGVRFLVN